MGIYAAIGPEEYAGSEGEEGTEKAFQMHAYALAERLLDICGDDGATAFNGDAQHAQNVAEAVITILEQQQQVATQNGDTGEKKNRKKRLVKEELIGAIVTRSTFRSASSSSSSSEAHNSHEALLPGQLPPGHSIRQFTPDISEQQMKRLASLQAALFFEARYGEVVDPEANLKDVAASVKKGWAWGYLVPGEQEDVVASALFLGRETPNGITIRIVYTAKEWRRRGFAEKLVRRVVEVLLGISEEGKQEAHGGKRKKWDHVKLLFIKDGPAEKIYRRIGFGGDGGVDESVLADIDVVDEEEGK